MQLETERYAVRTLVAHEALFNFTQLGRWVLKERDWSMRQDSGGLALGRFYLFANCGHIVVGHINGRF